MIILEETAGAGGDEISLSDALTDQVGFDFAARLSDVLGGGRVGGEDCALDEGSLAELRGRAGKDAPWKKTYLCGNVHPTMYSVETAAKSYGYDELDAGSPPENDDEREYLADREAWYGRLVGNALWDGMPRKAFGQSLKSQPFMLRATRPDGEGVGLACRIVSFW